MICLNAPSPLLDPKHMLACPPNRFSAPWATSLGHGALGLCPLGVQSPPSVLPQEVGAHKVTWFPLSQLTRLGSVGALGFLAGTQASAMGTVSKRAREPAIVYGQAEAGRQEDRVPGMREECLGGLLLSPTAQLPGEVSRARSSSGAGRSP